MNVLAFAASLRASSFNRRLVVLAAEIAREEGHDVDLAAFSDFDMPLYDGDLEHEHGQPPGAQALAHRIHRADALLLASPEYNYSIAGPLKNAIDWVSRVRPIPFRGKSIYLLSASPSPMGGIRGLWQTRIPLEGCGALVFPDMFALPHADKAFADDGSLAEPASADRLRKELVGFLRMAEALVPICGTAPKPRATAREIVAALEEQTELQPRA